MIRVNDNVFYSRTKTNTRKSRSYITFPAVVVKVYDSRAMIKIEPSVGREIIKTVELKSLKKVNMVRK